MKSTGIVRKVDELGRVVLPAELRKTLQIAERDPLEIYTDEDVIVLKKYEAGDIFTGTMEDLIDYKGRKISKSTIRELVRLAGMELKE